MQCFTKCPLVHQKGWHRKRLALSAGCHALLDKWAADGTSLARRRLFAERARRHRGEAGLCVGAAELGGLAGRSGMARESYLDAHLGQRAARFRSAAGGGLCCARLAGHRRQAVLCVWAAVLFGGAGVVVRWCWRCLAKLCLFSNGAAGRRRLAGVRLDALVAEGGVSPVRLAVVCQHLFALGLRWHWRLWRLAKGFELGVRAVCCTRLVLVRSEAISAQRCILLVRFAQLDQHVRALCAWSRWGRRVAKLVFLRRGAVVLLENFGVLRDACTATCSVVPISAAGGLHSLVAGPARFWVRVWPWRSGRVRVDVAHLVYSRVGAAVRFEHRLVLVGACQTDGCVLVFVPTESIKLLRAVSSGLRVWVRWSRRSRRVRVLFAERFFLGSIAVGFGQRRGVGPHALGARCLTTGPPFGAKRVHLRVARFGRWWCWARAKRFDLCVRAVCRTRLVFVPADAGHAL